ncbi:MAG: YsnF/AvaK domain-containing protein [Planctomycetes bacterium]|nr:YsnF/AvaK domain-containing protein [Planctomycetota bacterium]
MGTNKTCSTKVGIFTTKTAADKAVADLRAAGYRNDQIGILAKDSSGTAMKTDGAGETNAGEGAMIGAAAGAGVGGLVGLGILAGVIPVIGPILAIGTLGTILLNAAGGAAIASLTGALIGWGIPEEDAKYYESEVQAGRYLVTVDAGDRTDSSAVFTRHGGYDRATALATSGSTTSTGAGRTMEVKEEQLRATKESVNVGEVKVRKEVHTEHQQITVPVEHEEVVIERRTASGPGGAIRAEEIRIPVKEEQVNVSKETVVKEEVSVGKRKVQSTETVAGDVRKEEVVVEKDGKAQVRMTGKGEKK